MDFSFRVYDVTPWKVAEVGGEVDLAAAPCLEFVLADVLRESGHGVVAELGDVTFFDVAGLRAMLTARDAARLTGRELRLARPGPPVLRILELTDTLSRFAVYDDVPTAVAAGSESRGPALYEPEPRGSVQSRTDVRGDEPDGTCTGAGT